LLVFREKNETELPPVKTWLSPGSKIKCDPVFSNRKSFNAKVDSEGNVVFKLPFLFVVHLKIILTLAYKRSTFDNGDKKY
jgi:hypothetical protein